MSEIVTVIPTRGFIFADTLISLHNNGIYNPIIVKGLPIPDAQNECVKQALEEYSSYVLFIEDDMSFPEEILGKMMKMDEAIVAVDYPMDNGYSTIARQGTEILWCGLGCTLVKRGVLAAMKENWFDTSYSWRLTENPFKLERIDNPNKYGGHDINFCIKAREMGFKIVALPGVEAKHMRCKNINKSLYNNGQMEIYPLEPISKRQQY